MAADYKMSKGYLALSIQKQKEIDLLYDSGDEDKIAQAKGLLGAQEKIEGRADLMGKAASAATAGLGLIKKDESIDVGGRTEELTQKEKNLSVGGATAEGALSGASAGASFGPWGMAAGAVIGGGISLLKSKKASDDAEDDIARNRSTKLTTSAVKRGAEEQTKYNSAAPEYLSTGGFVKGKGGARDDKNDAKLNVGDYVMPAPKTSSAKSMVKGLAKEIGEDRQRKSISGGSTPVKLSNGELVIPANKVDKASKVARKMGTPIETMRNKLYPDTEESSFVKGKRLMARGGQVNPTDSTTVKPIFSKAKKKALVDMSVSELEQFKNKSVRSVSRNIPWSKPLDETDNYKKNFNNYLGYRKALDSKPKYKGKPVDVDATSGARKMAKGGWVEPAGMVAQAAAGYIGQYKAERNIKRKLKERREETNKQTGIAFQSKEKMDENVNRSFRDTERYVRQQKLAQAKNLAKNSLTPQEFNQNTNDMTTSMAEVVSKANIEKANALNNNEQTLFQARATVGRELNGHNEAETAFQTAKATQAATVAATGTQGAYDFVKGRKDELTRRKREQQLLLRAKEMGVEYELAKDIQDGNINSIKAHYKKLLGRDISDTEAMQIIKDKDGNVSIDEPKEEAKAKVKETNAEIDARLAAERRRKVIDARLAAERRRKVKGGVNTF